MTPYSEMFSYTSQTPARWPQSVAKFRDKSLSIPICWGAHERAIGIRDFSRGSPRDLERLLSVLSESRIKANFCLGFGTDTQAFPEWVEVGAKSARVPQPLSGGSENCFLSSAPSLDEAQFRTGFLDFISEVFSILALYGGAGGPVEQVTIDFGYLASGVGVAQDDKSISYLALRYLTIEALNKRYHTRFKSFSELNNEKAWQLLLDRRAWMAMFDYRWCRSQGLVSIWQTIAKIAETVGLKTKLTSSLHSSARFEGSSSQWELAVDPISLDTNGDKIFPLFPEGLVQHSAIDIYRMWNTFQSASQGRVARSLLPIWEPTDLLGGNLLVVVCGKYLPQASFVFLTKFLDGGGSLYFPFEIAQYDETMKCYDWAAHSERAQPPLDRFLRCSVKSSKIFTRREPLTPGPQMWDLLFEDVEMIESEIQ